MDQWSGNLISFDDDSSDDEKDSNRNVKKGTSKGAPERPPLPPKLYARKFQDEEVKRAYFTNVQYFCNPHHVPVYHPDDFIRESVNLQKIEEQKEIVKEHEKNLSRDKELIESLKNTNSVDQVYSPPLPPRRVKKTSDNTLLWQRLRDAGIIVSHTPKNPFYQDIDPDKVVNVVSQNSRGNFNDKNFDSNTTDIDFFLREATPVNHSQTLPNNLSSSHNGHWDPIKWDNNSPPTDNRKRNTNSHGGKLLPHQQIHAANLMKNKLQNILTDDSRNTDTQTTINTYFAMDLGKHNETRKVSKNPFLRTSSNELHKSKSLNDITDDEEPNQLNSFSLEGLDQLEKESDMRERRVHFDADAKSNAHAPLTSTRSNEKQRFSCPPAVFSEDQEEEMKEEKIFFRNELFQTSEERNEEARAFFTYIKDMRKLYNHDDITNNPGYITPAIVSNNALLNKQEEIFIYFLEESKPKIRSFDLSITSNDLMLQAIQLFKGFDFFEFEILSDKYVFRIVGEYSYLDYDVRLCDFVYVQDCVKHGKKIELNITLSSDINRELKREVSDDEHDNEVNFEEFFEVPTSISVSEQGLTMLLEAYNKEVAQVITNVGKPEFPQYLPDRLIQVVKAITMSLATVELLQIHDAISILLSLKATPSLIRTYSSSRDRKNYNEYISPLTFDHGRFHLALEKLTSGVHSLIELYCQAFHTGFKLQEIHKNSSNKLIDIDIYERIDARTITDKFAVRVVSVHRIPSKWKFMYECFDLECSLYYGGKAICKTKKSGKLKTVMGFFEHIRVSELFEFDIPVKKIPRETRVAFVLSGIATPKKGTDGRTILGWFTASVYDYEGFLLGGSKLYGLIANSDFNPVATCATNYIQHHETVILKVDFQLYHTEVLFPQPVFFENQVSVENGLSASSQFAISDDDYSLLENLFQKHTSLLTKNEKSLIWKNRHGLTSLPHALIYVLASVPSWDSEHVIKVHAILTQWTRLTSDAALEFLQADYPDKIVRETAVSWLSDTTNDHLSDYLPELVQALKYEPYHNSALARFLITRALKCPRIGLMLFWYVKYYIGDVQFCQRFQIVLSGFLSICGTKFKNELTLQDKMLVSLANVAKLVKQSKDSLKRYVLQSELEKINKTIFVGSNLRLPIRPGFKARNINATDSSYFSSNAVPLKIVLENCDPFGKSAQFIYKIGDDLRKDLVTILLFRTMNKLWIKEGLDLKMMSYNVLPTGPMTGLIEMVPNSSTFREIHVQHGLTGSFKDNSLALWLQRFNSTEEEYQKAIGNFTASAAGYCVATYLLGIGDRHNDNIMLTKNGHLFHIDFNKFMGDVQKFGSISRDRVPFVLTPDMAFVINNGISDTPNFQTFVEYCCMAFNIIRKNMQLFLNLLGLMVYSGISYLSDKDDLLYVRQALQMHLTEDEATVYFTRLIESSLSSKSTQLNFFIHNVAHMKNVTETILKSSNSSPLFSFSNKVYSYEEDGFVDTAHVVDFQKRYLPEKHYVFVINVIRRNNIQPKFVFRRYEDFQELHAKLCYLFNVFSGTILPELPSKIIFGRSQVRDVASRRRFELDQYLEDLSRLPAVWRSEVLHTFLHSYIKDIEEERNFADYLEILEDGCKSRIGGRIKLSMAYKNNAFHILIMHVSNLIPRRLQGLADPYVKIYMLPDPIKYTKRKTKIQHKTLNPTFNETVVYDVALELLQRRILQISVWDYDKLSENIFLGGINFYLSTFDLTKQKAEWFELEDIGLGK